MKWWNDAKQKIYCVKGQKCGDRSMEAIEFQLTILSLVNRNSECIYLGKRKKEKEAWNKVALN